MTVSDTDVTPDVTHLAFPEEELEQFVGEGAQNAPFPMQYRRQVCTGQCWGLVDVAIGHRHAWACLRCLRVWPMLDVECVGQRFREAPDAPRARFWQAVSQSTAPPDDWETMMQRKRRISYRTFSIRVLNLPQYLTDENGCPLDEAEGVQFWASEYQGCSVWCWERAGTYHLFFKDF